jgi:hypothetical protein
MSTMLQKQFLVTLILLLFVVQISHCERAGMEWHVSLEVREKKFWTLELFFMFREVRSTPFFCKLNIFLLLYF